MSVLKSSPLWGWDDFATCPCHIIPSWVHFLTRRTKRMHEPPLSPLHCKKKVIVLTVPSRDVTNQTLPGREEFGYNLVFSNISARDGKNCNLFYSVQNWCWSRDQDCSDRGGRDPRGSGGSGWLPNARQHSADFHCLPLRRQVCNADLCELSCLSVIQKNSVSWLDIAWRKSLLFFDWLLHDSKPPDVLCCDLLLHSENSRLFCVLIWPFMVQSALLFYDGCYCMTHNRRMFYIVIFFGWLFYVLSGPCMVQSF